MQSPGSNKTRAAFTLIELLVVIAIIAVLVGLLSAGIFAVFSRSNDVQNVNDITQISVALENFKAKFGFYPPSKIHLLESGQYTSSPLDTNSAAILKRIWPRIAYPIDWNGDGLTNGSFYLEGDQCLVFFLGGIQTLNPPGTLGFSANPANPAQPPTAGNQQRVGPFFNFQPNRLLSYPTHSNIFFSYVDIYRSTPFAYFSSLNGLKNQYNPYLLVLNPTTGSAYGSDCGKIGAMPYCVPVPNGVTLPAMYVNPDSYQLISAGADKFFGSPSPPNPVTPFGVIWDASHTPPGFAGVIPQTLPNGTVIPNPGMDDRTNFCPNILGAGNAQ